MKWLFKCIICGHHWIYYLPLDMKTISKKGQLFFKRGKEIVRQVFCIECGSPLIKVVRRPNGKSTS